jgi:hypothetical protein
MGHAHFLYIRSLRLGYNQPMDSFRSCHASPAALDEAGELVCERLALSFGLARPTRPHLPCQTSIGLEIEVPHSAYFPELWARWSLHSRRVSDLSRADLDAFGSELSTLETPLRERLELSAACGIPRGNDRYWEFSMEPVHDLGIAWEQVELLGAAGILPRSRRQALQATLGSLRPTADAYYLAMALEALHVEPERLVAGARQAHHKTIFTGWGRKGSSGILQKGPADLQHGATHAIELRALQLPRLTQDWEAMARLLCHGANALMDLQAARLSHEASWLARLRAACESALSTRGLPLANWWRTGPEGGIDLRSWERFAAALPSIAVEIEPFSLMPAHLAPAQASFGSHTRLG